MSAPQLKVGDIVRANIRGAARYHYGVVVRIPREGQAWEVSIAANPPDRRRVVFHWRTCVIERYTLRLMSGALQNQIREIQTALSLN